jgi:glycosyltransferase involved in cell wall biosynthesis
MPPPSVDVIVPVRGAGPVFRRCASSLIRHVHSAHHRLVVVLDGPVDRDAADALEGLSRAGIDLTVLEHREPQGFVSCVNEALGVSNRDVVLLNSDTQVTHRWLDKLGAAAYADPATATVTPFSNNATICSLPVFLAENTIPAGYDVDTFAALVERVAARDYPRLPTGVGACLYIKREAIEKVGVFDEVFGFGYGEETDFCLRASARGYRHILDDATFILHEGSRSFGTSRDRRVRGAQRLIRSRHPTYQRDLREFIRQDPIAHARARVIACIDPPRGAATSRRPNRVLHLVHGWPPWAHGGTELYAYRLAHQQAHTHTVAAYARVTDPDRVLGDGLEHLDRGVRVRLVVNNFIQRNPLCRNGFHCARLARDFARYLKDFQPTLLHVHHLAGHCASLLSVARKHGVPIVYQAQDWWPICARMNLANRDSTLCSGPQPVKCAHCLPLTNLPPAPTSSALLYRARKSWIRAQLAQVDAVVMGSEFIAESYRRWQVLPANTPVHVVPYGVPTQETTATGRPAAPGAPLRFGYIGALLPHKGVHVCVQAFRQLDGHPAELHLWGSSENRAYRTSLESTAGDSGRIHFHGPFPESAKSSILQSIDVLIMPSVGLESFGLVGREAMAAGVPVLASRRGALTELLTQDHGGALFVPEDPADLAAQMRRVIDEPELLGKWRHSLPSVKSIEHHAGEIDGIYQTLEKPQRR